MEVKPGNGSSKFDIGFTSARNFTASTLYTPNFSSYRSTSVRDLPVHTSNECHLQTRGLKPTKLVDRSFKRCFSICFNYSLERKFSMMLSKAVASLTSLPSQYKKRFSNIDSDVNSETQHEDIFTSFCCFGRSLDLEGIGC